MTTKKIGKYEIVRELGRGAMGIVYEGRDPDIGRKVAIKTIRFDVINRKAEQEEAQKRFMREAQSAGNLSHPNIVTIYDVGQDKGLTYIAMEFIEGEDLENLIAEGRRLPLESTINLIEQIGEALDFAHRHGIIHRDIKPGNVLIDKEGRPRLLDFGIARVSNSTMTQANTVMGTPYYMAPEQIAGRAVDHRADIFSLGAILYEILTLAKPFPGENMTTVIYRILNEDPPETRSFDRTLPAGLDYVVKKALAKNPAQRYQTCREFSDDLRNASAFAGQAFAGGTAAGGTEAAAPAEAKPRKPLLVVLGAMMLVVVVGTALVLLTKKSPRSADYGGGGGGIPAPAASKGNEAPAKTEAQGQDDQAAAAKPEAVKTEPAVKSAEDPAAAPSRRPGGGRENLSKTETKAEPARDDDAVRRASEIEDRLQLVRTAFQRESFEVCIREARKILALAPDHAEAKKFLDMATIKYGPMQIQSMLLSYLDAVKRGTILDFFGLNGTPAFFNAIKTELLPLLATHDTFQATASGVSTLIMDNLDGTYRAEMTFSEIFTARSRARNRRVVISEGKVLWNLIQSGEDWLIQKITRLAPPD